MNRKLLRNKNLAGRSFGPLTVESFSHSLGNGRYWNCRCKCGNVVVSSTGALSSDTNKIGCVKCYSSKIRRSKAANWHGTGDIGAANFSKIKISAQKRNLVFRLTIEEVWKLFLDQNGRCALSGEPLFFANGNHGTASLDRIDNSGGYHVGNIQWVHKEINLMKRGMSDAKFTDWAHKVSNYQLQKP